MTARRSWWKVVLGVIFTALMLFPVYWMINVSLTRTEDLRANPPHIFPFDPTFEASRPSSVSSCRTSGRACSSDSDAWS